MVVNDSWCRLLCDCSRSFLLRSGGAERIRGYWRGRLEGSAPFLFMTQMLLFDFTTQRASVENCDFVDWWGLYPFSQTMGKIRI